MKQPLSDETAQALAKLAAPTGALSFAVNTHRVCDNCRDQDKEAFPYHVYDRQHRFWDDLCNDCYDELGCNEAAKIKNTIEAGRDPAGIVCNSLTKKG